MASDDSSPNAEAFLALLREDARPVPSATRTRLRSRLGSLAAGSPGPAPLRSAHPTSQFWRSKASTALLVLPLGALLGAAGHGWLSAHELPAPRPLSSLHFRLDPAISAAPTPTPVPVALAPTPVDVAPVAVKPTRVAVVPTPKPAPSVALTTPSSERAPVTIDSAPPSLRDDVSLLELARTAFAEGDAVGSLARLTIHQRRFPSSPLRQEREALEVKVLMALGRTAEAKRLAAVFLERYPRSSLRGPIARAVGTKP